MVEAWCAVAVSPGPESDSLAEPPAAHPAHGPETPRTRPRQGPAEGSPQREARSSVLTWTLSREQTQLDLDIAGATAAGRRPCLARSG